MIRPNSFFKTFWNAVLVLMLVYTASYMPFKTCFIEDSSVLSDVVDALVDFLFTVDIAVNFLSIIEKNDGHLIYQPKQIARIYIRSWFIFDLISVLPISVFEGVFQSASGSENNSVAGYN